MLNSLRRLLGLPIKPSLSTVAKETRDSRNPSIIQNLVVAISEIDPYAINSYKAIHGETLNLGDISKVDPKDVPDCDLLTYNFPCISVSISGKKE